MTATISWWIKNFRWAKIDGAGPVPTEIKDPAGSIKVSGKDLAGNAGRSLQLTVQGTDKSYLYRNVSFELCGMPLIKNFRASPRPSVYEPVRIKKGDRVTFSYFFTNVARAGIWAGGRKLADAKLPSDELYGTSTEFIPDATGSTELYAYNCAGDVIKSEAVGVEVYSAAPEITGFFCDIAGLVIRRSQPVTFRWTIREAAEAWLDNSRVNPSIGSQTIQGLAVPKEFVLTAKNPAGKSTQNIFIDVMPEILSFTSSSPGPIVPGDSVELRWSVAPKARALTLRETFAEPPAGEPRQIVVENAETGSVFVSPKRTAVYRLTIEGPIPGELYKEDLRPRPHKARGRLLLQQPRGRSLAAPVQAVLADDQRRLGRDRARHWPGWCPRPDTGRPATRTDRIHPHRAEQGRFCGKAAAGRSPARDSLLRRR